MQYVYTSRVGAIVQLSMAYIHVPVTCKLFSKLCYVAKWLFCGKYCMTRCYTELKPSVPSNLVCTLPDNATDVIECDQVD